MIKITNGLSTIEVTKGAYENIYKPMGFQDLSEFENNNQINEDENQVKVEGKVDEVEIEETQEDDNEEVDKAQGHIAELKAKPISGWNKHEVKEYAELTGIDLTGTKNVNEAKELIAKTL